MMRVEAHTDVALHRLLAAAGSNFLLWFGPTARLAVADPDLIREIFVSRSEFFERYESHPLVRQLEGEGLVSLRGEKWAHHRKVITPTFHMENLKVPAAAPPRFSPPPIIVRSLPRRFLIDGMGSC